VRIPRKKWFGVRRLEHGSLLHTLLMPLAPHYSAERESIKQGRGGLHCRVVSFSKRTRNVSSPSYATG